MKQKQYHSLEELPLMMNMTDVAAARPWHFQSRSVQTRPQRGFPGFPNRQAHRSLAGEIHRLVKPTV